MIGVVQRIVDGQTVFGTIGKCRRADDSTWHGFWRENNLHPSPLHRPSSLSIIILLFISIHPMASIISLIGAPGSGKGTYGALLASRLLNTAFISVGDILREESASRSELAKVLNSGALVDDTLVNDAVLRCLEERTKEYRIDDASNRRYHVILDGYPRTDRQASLLDKWPIDFYPKFALQLDVPERICITKILGRRKCILCSKSLNVNGVLDEFGFDMPPMLPYDNAYECRTMHCNPDVHWKKRNDDTTDTIEYRMDVYRRETEPVLHYWEEKGKLLRFIPYKGIKEIDNIVSLIEARLGRVIT